MAPIHQAVDTVDTGNPVDGFLAIDKPAGITSHDVVARLRRATRQKRIGHAGTLDPAATGVLVLALGQATRLIEYVQDETIKHYEALIRLGVTTTTDDAEGEALAHSPVPALALDTIAATLQQFEGTIMQVPPIYSALHHRGQRLYEIARAGQTVDIPARPVQIDSIAIRSWQSPDLAITVACGKGTYIRSLARDIGQQLGCGGYLAALRRTRVGTFTIEAATPLDQAAAHCEAGHASDLLHPADLAVRDWPAVEADAALAQRILRGLPVDLPTLTDPQAARVRVHYAGRLLALLIPQQGRWQPKKVFATERE